MRDADWIGRALRDAGASGVSVNPGIDVTDRVLRTLSEPADRLAPTRSVFVTTAVCCLIAASSVVYAASAWIGASDPFGAALSPVRLALNDG